MPEYTDETAAIQPSGSNEGVTQGATIIPTYAQRFMTSYAVTDHELDTLSLANTGAVFCWSVATFLLGVASSIWIGVALVSPISETAKLLSAILAPVLAVLAVALIAAAVVLRKYRKTQVDRIKAQSGASAASG